MQKGEEGEEVEAEEPKFSRLLVKSLMGEREGEDQGRVCWMKEKKEQAGPVMQTKQGLYLGLYGMPLRDLKKNTRI